MPSFPSAVPRLASRWLPAVVLWALAGALQAQTSAGNAGNPLSDAADVSAGGPFHLRSAGPAGGARGGGPQGDERAPGAQAAGAVAPMPPAQPVSEFERYVQAQAGGTTPIRRVGAELVTGNADTRTAELSPLVPDDYVVGPGDEVLLALWGGVDAELRLLVDRSGRINIPRVGAVQVSGIRYADLPEVVNRRVAQVFRNFQSSVTLGQLRGIRVFATGFVVHPGAYTVNSLTSIVAVLMRAGGPSASGSFRLIELRRGSEVVTRFDLYDLLSRGDRSGDRVVQAGDVVHVGPVGVQVGVIGSVNRPAIVELKPGETVADALGYAGGFSAVADRSRLAIERLRDRNAGRVSQLTLPQGSSESLSEGDVLRAFSAVDAVLPIQAQNKRVRVEGEVMRPGEYVLPEASTLNDAVRAAGGFTQVAYLRAAEFTRLSVRARQQENYDRALRDLESDMSRTFLSRRVSSTEEAASLQASNVAVGRMIERLRSIRPTGRLVLQIPELSPTLPDLALEDGDRLYVPSRPTTIGVFGSVFNAATYLYIPGRTLGDYLRLAGGPTKGADESSIFLVRADGHVVSNRQGAGGWFARDKTIDPLAAEPGDTIFVPEELDKTTFVQIAKDWTQILYQFGLGAAGIRSAIR